MRLFSQTTMTALMFFVTATACRAEDEPTKQWVWLPKQTLIGFGYKIADGPHRGLWRIDPETKRLHELVGPPAPVVKPAPAANPVPPPPAARPAADPYGFAAHLNTLRASAGLPPLAYDPGLSNWAARNNSAQASHGLGHHINPNCFQNCAWNTTTAASTADQWVASAGHRENMLTRSARTYGIAFGPGPYWTLNLR